MLDQRRVATQPDEKREQLFTERYESLLAWALRLTNQQREAAEDLVQDALFSSCWAGPGSKRLKTSTGISEGCCATCMSQS